MNGAELWKAKVAQLLHDPFLKAWCQGDVAKAIARDLGEAPVAGDEVPEILWDQFAQDKVAALLSARLLGSEVVLPDKAVRWKHGRQLEQELDAGILGAPLAPDLAASGADRPVLGTWRQVRVQLWGEGQDHVMVTHPLAAAPLRMPAPKTKDALLEAIRPSAALLDGYQGMLPAGGEARHRLAWYLAWRRLPEELARQDGVFWPLQPADTRCPDHSIWDHLRVTSSLAFIPRSHAADERLRAANPGRRPWLLSLWVGPARDFVGQARTGRDLWTGSMMLSELAWALVEPVVERLGPDAVLYPDLRANPRADRWIDAVVGRAALGEDPRASRASLIPNRLVVLVPEADREEIAAACLDSARQRWEEMARHVRSHLSGLFGEGSWRQVFDAQVAKGPAVRWVAARWDWDGRPEVQQTQIHLDPAIPFQDDPPGLPPAIRDIERAREGRYEGWVDRPTWEHYQAARQAALMTHVGYLLGQRGFDYPVVHHQLLALDAARSGMGREIGRAEPGEKCTLCGVRQALTDGDEGTAGRQREDARQLWSRVDPEGTGAERLCGPCAVRRFLTDTADPMKESWAATVHPAEAQGKHNAPFPSTGLIAGQGWLAEVCRRRIDSDDEMRRAMAIVVKTFPHLVRTQFAGALPRLRRFLRRRSESDSLLEVFLSIDVQYLAPELWGGLAERGIVPSQTARTCRVACQKLQRIAGSPGTHIAVIALDGDKMGRLLLGDPAQVKARWRDVLHPSALEQLRDGDEPWKAFWRTTLERPRLMGPSTHAFVSRALRHFANRVLPWVVEREFGGRLVYAGGDDALILCPAGDALPLVARLDALFTSAWVLDRRPEANPWPTNEPDDSLYEVGGDRARERFRVLDGDARGVGGRVIPMLGEHQSFSAGVAFGHFKTSLRLLRAEALAARDAAKAEGGRRAGLRWFTRSGLKLRWTAPLQESAGGVEQIHALAKGFASRAISGRLPYKLREALPSALAAVESERRDILRGLVVRALDGGQAPIDEISATWAAGFPAKIEHDFDPEASLGGLLVARALAGMEDR